MASGNNKTLVINSIIAVTGCLFVIISHQAGYEWYMEHFNPSSRGVSLGFVILYMKYVTLPAVFISAFIKVKYSLIMMALINIYMFIFWYDTNPLRVILMFTSCLLGYAVVIFSGIFKDKYMKM